MAETIGQVLRRLTEMDRAVTVLACHRVKLLWEQALLVYRVRNWELVQVRPVPRKEA